MKLSIDITDKDSQKEVRDIREAANSNYINYLYLDRFV